MSKINFINDLSGGTIGAATGSTPQVTSTQSTPQPKAGLNLASGLSGGTIGEAPGSTQQPPLASSESADSSQSQQLSTKGRTSPNPNLEGITNIMSQALLHAAPGAGDQLVPENANPLLKYIGGAIDNLKGNIKKDIGIGASIAGKIVDSQALKDVGAIAIKSGVDQAAQASQSIDPVTGFIMSPSGLMMAGGIGGLFRGATLGAEAAAANAGLSLSTPKLAWETIKNVGKMTPALATMGVAGVGSDYMLNKTIVQPNFPVHEDENGKVIINNEQDAENYAINSAMRGIGGLVTGGIMAGAASGVKYFMNKASLANKLEQMNLSYGDLLGQKTNYAKQEQDISNAFGGTHEARNIKPDELFNTEHMVGPSTAMGGNQSKLDSMRQETTKNVERFIQNLSTQTTPITKDDTVKLQKLGDYLQSKYTVNPDGSTNNPAVADMHEGVQAMIRNFQEGNTGPGVMKEFADRINSSRLLEETANPLVEARKAYSLGQEPDQAYVDQISHAYGDEGKAKSALAWLKKNGTLDGVHKTIMEGKLIEDNPDLAKQVNELSFPSIEKNIEFNTLLEQHKYSVKASQMEDDLAVAAHTSSTDLPVDLTRLQADVAATKIPAINPDGTSNKSFGTSLHEGQIQEQSAQRKVGGILYGLADKGMLDPRIMPQDHVDDLIGKFGQMVKAADIATNEAPAPGSSGPVLATTKSAARIAKNTEMENNLANDSVLGEMGLGGGHKIVTTRENIIDSIKGMRDNHQSMATLNRDNGNGTAAKLHQDQADNFNGLLQNTISGLGSQVMQSYGKMTPVEAQDLASQMAKVYSASKSSETSYRNVVKTKSKHELTENAVIAHNSPEIILSSKENFQKWAAGQAKTQEASELGMAVGDKLMTPVRNTGKTYLEHLAETLSPSNSVDKSLLEKFDAVKNKSIQGLSQAGMIQRSKLGSLAAMTKPDYLQDTEAQFGTPAMTKIFKAADASDGLMSTMRAHPNLARVLFNDKGEIRTTTEMGKILTGQAGTGLPSNNELRAMLQGLQRYKTGKGENPLEDIHNWMMDSAKGGYYNAKQKILSEGGSENATKAKLDAWMRQDKAVSPVMALGNPADGLAFKDPLYFLEGRDMRKVGDEVKTKLGNLITEIQKSDSTRSPKQSAEDIIAKAKEVEPVTGVGKSYISASNLTHNDLDQKIHAMATAAISAAEAGERLSLLKKAGKAGTYGTMLGSLMGTHSMLENMAYGLGMSRMGKQGVSQTAQKIQRAFSSAGELNKLSELSKQRTLSNKAVVGATAATSELNRR